MPPAPTGHLFVGRDARSTSVLALPPTPGGVHTSADSPASWSPCRGIRDQSAALCVSDQTKGKRQHLGCVTRQEQSSCGKSKSCLAPEPRNSRASVPPALNSEVHATAPLPTVRRQVVPETRTSRSSLEGAHFSSPSSRGKRGNMPITDTTPAGHSPVVHRGRLRAEVQGDYFSKFAIINGS